MESTPAKPREGAACNGCGLCCALQLCGLAVEFLASETAPCPAMEFAGGRFWCGLAKNPGRYWGTPTSANKLLSLMVQQALIMGEGCDAGD